MNLICYDGNKDTVAMKRQNALTVSLLIAMMAVSLPSLSGLPMSVNILLLILYVVVLGAFAFVHGAQTLGLRGIVVFFFITAITTYFMEWLGTHLGIPFGHYYYTNRLGPLLMDVPIVIPLQWFNILYATYIMAQVALSGMMRDVSDGKQSRDGQNLFAALPRLLVISILTGLFMVSWDFINDPYMVGVGMWVWINPKEFLGQMLFGIPLSNFLGWILTSAVVVLMFEIYKRNDHNIRGTQRNSTGEMRILVMVPYLYMCIFQAVSGAISGVFPLSSLEGLGPIALATVSVGLATTLTMIGYVRLRNQPHLQTSS
ncbi:MAG: carotenoid biosynthesis protein [Candidatus Thorarchaeota archaeon]